MEDEGNQLPEIDRGFLSVLIREVWSFQRFCIFAFVRSSTFFFVIFLPLRITAGLSMYSAIIDIENRLFILLDPSRRSPMIDGQVQGHRLKGFEDP